MTATPANAAVGEAQPSDIGHVSRLLADAFLNSPVGDWLIPDLVIRRRVYVYYFAIFVRHGLRHATVALHQTRTGAAIWYPRGEATPGPDNYQTQLAAACGPWTGRFQLLDATLAERHPAAFHHHLAFLGVSPTQQNKGVGSELLQHHHTLLDHAGIPAYLQASTARSRDLYLRHGYEAGQPFHLPDDGPPLWPMWRHPTPGNGNSSMLERNSAPPPANPHR